jgi:hypothetical protein
MQIFIDLNTRRLRRSAAISDQVTQLDFKRGDDAEIEIQFVRGNTVEELPVGAVISFGVKKKDDYDGPALVFSNEFTLSGSGESAKYIGFPNFSTAPIDAELGVGEAPDKKQVDLISDFLIVTPGRKWSTEEFAVRVTNNVTRGDEATPAALPDPAQWMRAPLVLAAPPEDGQIVPVAIDISGALTDGANPVTFPQLLLQEPNVNGRVQYYDEDGIGLLYWQAPQWRLDYSLGGIERSWRATSDVVSPDLVPPSAWAPVSPATGVPVIEPTLDFGTVPAALGQLAIVNTADVYVATSVSPAKWVQINN